MNKILLYFFNKENIVDELEYRGQLAECEYEYKDTIDNDILNLPFSPQEMVEAGYTMIEISDE